MKVKAQSSILSHKSEAKGHKLSQMKSKQLGYSTHQPKVKWRLMQNTNNGFGPIPCKNDLQY